MLEEILKEITCKYRVVKNEEDLLFNRGVYVCEEIIKSHIIHREQKISQKGGTLCQ